LKFASSKEPYL